MTNATIPEAALQWLRNSEIPYVGYNADLLFCPESARPERLYNDPFVQEQIELLQDWNSEVLQAHNKPSLMMHRLGMLADLEVKAGAPKMDKVIAQIVGRTGDDGVPLSIILVPKVFRGSGEPEEAWVICDYPQILYALLRMGVTHERILKGVKTLEGLVEENGFHCISSMKGFRGPGSKADPCPYATLLSLKTLSQTDSGRRSPAAKTGCEMLLSHWEQRKEKKYFMFGIGTDFGKLKFPLVWYNILHVLETLSRYEQFLEDRRLLEMAAVLLSKADDLLRFTPESMYRMYKGRDFANKKEPSPTMTLIAFRILLRLGLISF